MEETQQHISESTVGGQKQTSPQQIKRLIILLLVILIFVGVGVFYTAGAKKTTPNNLPETTVTPTPDFFPTDTPVLTEPLLPTETLTKTPIPVPTIHPIDKTTGLDRRELSVTVQNGSGETGVGTRGSEILKSLGYRITSVSNADHFNYENVTIYIQPSKSKYLELLKKDLATVYTIGSTSAQLTASTSADAVVIVGK